MKEFETAEALMKDLFVKAKKAKITNKMIAERTGLSQQSVHNFSVKENLKLITVKTIAEALGYEIKLSLTKSKEHEFSKNQRRPKRI